MAQKKALIVGWFGCQEKYLHRYVDLYRRLGYEAKTYTFSIPKAVTYTGWKKSRQEAPFKNDKYDVVQMFSGGVIPFFNGAFNQNHDLGQKALVFDSGPYFPTPKQVTTYVNALMPPPGQKVFRAVGAEKLAGLAIDNFWKMESYYWSQRLPEFRNAFLCDRPKLVMSNPKDNFMVHEDLKEWVDQVKANGTALEQHDFDSPHVQHYRFHPKKYEDVLHDFLSKHTR